MKDRTISFMYQSQTDMEKAKPISETSQICEEEEEREELIKTLPKKKRPEGIELVCYEGFWYRSKFIHDILSFQQSFKGQDTDLILAIFPKSGTTWLKALSFAIANRTKHPLLGGGATTNPLLTANPHDLIPFLEFNTYGKNPLLNLQDFPSPRILATHMPYSALPVSIRVSSSCRVVYLCRNPLDQFISFTHFDAKLSDRPFDPILLEESFDMTCRGVSPFGPFWDHVLGYWKASHERPDQVLFLKYEDLKEDAVSHLKLLAEFMGFPFSAEEESLGVIEEILKLCSFDNLKDLEVNKIHKNYIGLSNSAYFRKGEVGDWANYLTPSMAERMKNIMEKKFAGTGLDFKFS